MRRTRSLGTLHGMSLSTLVRVTARPLLASIFVYGGLDAFRSPDAKAPKADSLLAPVVDRVPGVQSSAQLVKLDAAVKVAGGVALGLGILPRTTAALLAGSLVATTIAGHDYWNQDEPQARAMQRLQLVKNASILGGVLLVVAGGGSRPKR
jgi:uncharacterized membrane protein YphA (DoxX/SURF4 family)